MATITLKGNEIKTVGDLPAVGSQAKDFTLIKNDLSELKLSDLSGKKVILNIFPSVDTGTCATSVREFNKLASGLDNTVVVCVSRDLPFAQARFCGAEGLDQVITASDYITGKFGQDYGLEIENGPLTGLHSRSIITLDESHKVTYNEQVTETVDEPNYDAALAALK